MFYMCVVIRTDASIELGTGHVMRCLTLAKQLERHGANVTFICRALEGNSTAYLISQGMNVLQLPIPKTELSHVQWMKEHNSIDAAETIELIQALDTEVGLLIVDHYALDERFERALRPFTKKILVIDDLGNRRHDTDILLDQNTYFNMENRYYGLVPEHCTLLLGPNYLLLRDEFIEAVSFGRRIREEVNNLFVFFGGTDPSGETVKTLQALKELDLSDVEIDVVVGAMNPRRVEIEHLCAELTNVTYHCQISHMAQLMMKADIAIGAGGATTWERCFLGLPTLAIVIADNQLAATKYLHDREVIYYIGESERTSKESIIRALESMLADREKLKRLSTNSLNIINAEKIKESSVLQVVLQVLGGIR